MLLAVSAIVLLATIVLLLRRRTWRREDVADVFMDNDKNQNARLRQYFVRMKTRGGQSIAFCHYRDSVERHRVLVALREALNLPPLADGAIAEE